MEPKIPILIIEDDHDIRVCFREVLESFNFQIHSATNGKDALILLSSLPSLPRLIITDVSMPFMDANDFIRVKNQDERFREIPVLIVSAHTDKFRMEGSFPVLSKPVDLNEFVGKVHSCLELRSEA